MPLSGKQRWTVDKPFALRSFICLYIEIITCDPLCFALRDSFGVNELPITFQQARDLFRDLSADKAAQPVYSLITPFAYSRQYDDINAVWHLMQLIRALFGNSANCGYRRITINSCATARGVGHLNKNVLSILVYVLQHYRLALGRYCQSGSDWLYAMVNKALCSEGQYQQSKHRCGYVTSTGRRFLSESSVTKIKVQSGLLFQLKGLHWSNTMFSGKLKPRTT